MLGVKAAAFAAFGNRRRSQEPRAMLEKGLLQTPEGDERFEWNKVLVDYNYDASDESKLVTGMVVLVTNAKTVASFVQAGGAGGMKCQDGTDRKYNRQKDKMLQVLKEILFVPFFVRPYTDKVLFVPLAGFPFREELVCSSCLNARSWLLLPANQVMTKLEPLLQSLGAPFVGKVVHRLPVNGGVEQWESFYDTHAKDEVSSLYDAPCCVYIRIPRTSPRLTPPACLPPASAARGPRPAGVRARIETRHLDTETPRPGVVDPLVGCPRS